MFENISELYTKVPCVNLNEYIYIHIYFLEIKLYFTRMKLFFQFSARKNKLSICFQRYLCNDTSLSNIPKIEQFYIKVHLGFQNLSYLCSFLKYFFFLSHLLKKHHRTDNTHPNDIERICTFMYESYCFKLKM